MSTIPKIQIKNLEASPDEVLESEKEKIELVSLGDLTVARVTLQSRMELGKICQAQSQHKEL